MKIGTYWVLIARRGLDPGQVGVLSCLPADVACLDGRLVHDPNAFTWYVAPEGGGLSLMQQEGTSLVLAESAGWLRFDVPTGVFTSLLKSG